MIGLHIINQLNADPALAQATKGRIYPLFIPQGAPEFPFVTFDVQDESPDYELDMSKAADNYTVTVYVATKDYTQLCSISRMVRKALELKNADYDDFSVISATYLGGEQDYEEQSDSLLKIMQFAFTTTDNTN